MTHQAAPDAAAARERMDHELRDLRAMPAVRATLEHELHRAQDRAVGLRDELGDVVGESAPVTPRLRRVERRQEADGAAVVDDGDEEVGELRKGAIVDPRELADQGIRSFTTSRSSWSSFTVIAIFSRAKSSSFASVWIDQAPSPFERSGNDDTIPAGTP